MGDSKAVLQSLYLLTGLLNRLVQRHGPPSRVREQGHNPSQSEKEQLYQLRDLATRGIMHLQIQSYEPPAARSPLLDSEFSMLNEISESRSGERAAGG